MIDVLRSRTLRLVMGALASLTLLAANTALAADQMTQPFTGKAVNGGTVTATQQNGKTVLTVSKDFQVPGSPDPHWQVVDSKGTVYLLDRVKLKEDKINRSIVLPTYIQDIAKVQMWCAWAEVVLGEASFSMPVVMK